MTFLLRTFALVALLALGAGVVHAQDDEPAAAAADGTATDQGSAKTARRARHGASSRRALAAARRAAMARTEEPATAPSSAPKPIAAPAETTAPVDARPADTGITGIDTMPAIAPVTEETSPEHGGTAAGHGHQGGATNAEHGAAATGAGHEAQGEHGAGHGEHAGFSAGTFALQLVNFGVLLFILIWFGGRAMNKALRARHEQLKNDIQEAARLRDEATKKFQAQEQRVVDLEKEIAALRTSMQQQAEQDHARLLEGAQERAKRIQDDMRLQLNQQVKEAESLLRAEVASASVKLAEELLRKSVNTDDERRLAREFVAGFAGVDSPTGPQGQGQGGIR